MKKVEAIFKWVDSADGLEYSQKETAYKINENYIIYEDKQDNGFIIEQITSQERDSVFIVENDETEDEDRIYPICIAIQNVKGFDITNDSLINFAKYLLKLRVEKQF